jgi:hypothetical protein
MEIFVNFITLRPLTMQRNRTSALASGNSPGVLNEQIR